MRTEPREFSKHTDNRGSNARREAAKLRRHNAQMYDLLVATHFELIDAESCEQVGTTFTAQAMREMLERKRMELIGVSRWKNIVSVIGGVR